MKCYTELPCNNMEIISKKIYNFLETKTNLLDSDLVGWQFLDCKSLLVYVPELLEFFKQNKLIPRDAAITIIKNNDNLPMHVDEPPVVAKVNMPVINTKGWANRWYVDGVMVAEILDLSGPVVFNSQIPHSVEEVSPVDLPRIIASFTFHNEPLDLLK